MPVVHIRDIEKKIDCVDVIAEVTANTGARTFGNNGKYVNLDLLDDGFVIKLTVFGESVSKVEKIEVIVFVCGRIHDFFSQLKSNEILFIFIVFQAGDIYHFKDCHASQVNPTFAHRHSNVKGLELKGNNGFDARKMENGAMAASERISLNAKKEEVRAATIKFECPKMNCAHQMARIDTGGFQCMNCDAMYSTFKFRGDEQQIDDEAEKKSQQAKRAATDDAEVDAADTKEKVTPTKRARRGCRK